MSANLTKTELKALTRILEEGEEVIAVGRQHRLTKLIAPAMTLATDKRLIIMKRDVLGIRSDMHFIPYEHIVSFRLVHGFIFSSIKLRLLGASKPNEHAVTSEEEDETEINGLTKGAARLLAGKLSANIHNRLNAKGTGETVIHHTTPIVNIFIMGNSTYKAMPNLYLPNVFETGENAVVNDYNNPLATDFTFEEKASNVEKEAETEDGEVAYAIEKPPERKQQTTEMAVAKPNTSIMEAKRKEPEERKDEKQPEQKQQAPAVQEENAVRPEDLQIFKKRMHRNPIRDLTFLQKLFASKQPGKDEFLEGIEGKYLGGDY